ncbi:MAG: TIM barrel protein, partial [Propionibacteriaceae bacterium]|nr:TIM barrel protein [Propionibacteriaceae bacterium]
MSDIIFGSHVEPLDPVGEAQARGVHLAQLMLGDPQKWTAPAVLSPGGASALRAAAADAGIALVVHAAYLINVASTNNRVRIPSRQLLQKTLNAAAEIGALGVVVHGGHVTAADDPAAGVENWFKAISG